MLDQFLATLRDSDLVVPVFCFSYNRRCGNRNSRVVNSDREPIATLFIWRIQLGKGIGRKKNDCQKKLNDSIESESKKKKREEKASQHQHIFNKRNKFTTQSKVFTFHLILFEKRRGWICFCQIILIATCNCSSLHTLCSYIYSTQPIHLFQFHFHPNDVCITIVYSLNYRTYRAQLMFRRLPADQR